MGEMKKILVKQRIFKTNVGEGKKILVASIFSFLGMFSTLSKTEIVFLATLNLLSANAVCFVNAKILSFGKELYMYFTNALNFDRLRKKQTKNFSSEKS